MKTRSAAPDVKFCLGFGGEELSIPAMRRVLGDTLRGLGVDEEPVYDILLAVTEACTNVLGHGRPYSVMISLTGARCLVQVTGPGRRIRGLSVARACVDNVTLRRYPRRGTVVTLRKHITWSWDAPLHRILPFSA